jgi:peroxiredoxin
MESAGNPEYQKTHMAELFDGGMSFSGYERDGLYLNRGDGTYLEISGVSGLDSLTDGRGCSFADLDNDGDLDVIITPVQETARLVFRNEVGQDNGFVRVRLTGTRSAPDAFGTVVRMKTPLGTQTKIKLGGSGFVSSSDPRLVFGLGPRTGRREKYEMEVHWPSGLVEHISDARPGESLHILEGTTTKRTTEKRMVLPGPDSASTRLFRLLAVERGKKVPELALTALDSEAIRLSSVLRRGQKTLINFWATWCVPCGVEIPELARLYEGLRAAGVDLLGISLDSGQPDQVRAYLEERSVPYRNFVLEPSELGKVFAQGQATVPLTLLIDEEGGVVDAFSGWSSETRAFIEALASQEGSGKGK